ncbi:MAG TPA: sugar ABC transporter ATP-binding protein [Microbacteriaceae bacterium]|nr:sugar ABC transporter ATP-binding protein [Microbacteriaceae bacterium]
MKTVDDALVVTNLTKSFNRVTVLHPLDFRVAPGEVHALVGQNGSGKSTLVKCLTGVHAPDTGEFTVFGKKVNFPVQSPTDHGIAVIHQDIGLVEDLTVLENLGINAKYGTRLASPISNRREKEIYRELLARLEIDLPFDQPVSTLSPAEHSLIGVLRAMRVMEGHQKQIFILDEPTAHLSRTEAQRITKFMRKVAELGSSVIFISHRLNEVLDYCDAVTVIRDGKIVASGSTANMTKSDLVNDMLGRRMVDFYPEPPVVPEDSPTVLEVDGIQGNTVQNVSLKVRANEIVGITGLAGMGQEELPYLISGASSPKAGTVTVNGKKIPLGNSKTAITNGIGLVPSNRQRDGLWMDATAAENVTLPALSKWKRKFRFYDWKSEKRAANEVLEDSGLRPLAPNRLMRMFSGGNQQKVVFSKWLQLSPKVFLLDEPTQGVDAGAGRELLERTARLADDGAAVIVFSGDHEQLAAICNRVIILNDGYQVGELVGDELSQHALLVACEDHLPVKAA